MVCKVLDWFEAQMGFAYSIPERIYYFILWWLFLCCVRTSNVVWASDLRAFSLGVSLFLMFVIRCANDSDVLYVTPRILGVCVCVRRVLFEVRCGTCFLF